MYTHVVFDNKSVLHIDLFASHRRFRLTESLREYKNILAYFAQAGLVDITKARQQVVIYELTRAAHHDKLRAASKKLEVQARYTERLYHVVYHLATVITGTRSAMFCK